MASLVQRAPAVVRVKVGAAQAGQRIDNFLVRHLKGVPRSHVYRILRSGEVRVNKGRVKPSYRLAADDEIRVPPVRTGTGTHSTAPASLQASLAQAVLLEDDELLVLNKPAGLAVHGGSGLPFGLIEALRQARPHAPMLELGHRLDRDTSGCLLIAKSSQTLNALHTLLRAGKVDKRYLALLAGSWQGGARMVAAPVARRVDARGMVVSERGKQAHSTFKPLERFAQSTLTEVRIATGRMHQIRLHAAHVGHPIAGDKKYGDASFNRLMRAHGLQRLFLHAASLSFQMPDSGRRYTVTAPLDAALQQVLEQLSEKSRAKLKPFPSKHR
jgi:23S rRNA pseudouridine955/2504/2580 synthase